jgi:signal transduction histidine kinase
MGNAVRMEADSRLDGVIEDAREELASLRRELAQYGGVFDSARLVVGHEFAKPLTAIGGYLELLEERFGPSVGDKERSYFAKIHEALGRLEGLVESFVQMLRVEKGAGDLGALERIDIRSFIEGVRERFAEQAPLVAAHVGAGIPPLLVRRRCLEVVVENLISNAIKHGGASDVVDVTASLEKERRGASKENILVITVEDHGVGIPEDKIEDIFKPFFRIENGASAGGLGLGLALVRSIITIMKGEIHVRSKQGEGTKVTVTIPVLNDTRTSTESIG